MFRFFIKIIVSCPWGLCRDSTWLWPGHGLCSSLWETLLSSARTPLGQSKADLGHRHWRQRRTLCPVICHHPCSICGFYTFRFISYCVKEGGYNGFNFTDAEGEDEVTARLANLKISSDGDSECFHETIIWMVSSIFNICVSKLHVSGHRSWNGEHPPAMWGPRMEKWALRS